MTTIRFTRTIGHREYVAYGVNAALLASFDAGGWFKYLLGEEDHWMESLTRAVVAQSYPERVQFGKECIQQIWRKHIPFGPCNLLPLLSEFEFDRKFYSGYRDHVTHQLKVLLLGLYIYQNCPAFFLLAQKEFGTSEAFVKRWILAALFHDVGYVFETGDATANKHAKSTIEALAASFSDPITPYIKWRYNSSVLESEMQEIRSELRLSQKSLLCFDDLLQTSDKAYVLESLECRAKQTGLGKGERPLDNYLQYARANRPFSIDRPSFIDHGIASAILLKHNYSEALTWSQALCSSVFAQQFNTETCPGLVECHSDFLKIKDAVDDAALAIAIHNISPQIWEHEHAYRWNGCKLTLNRFQVSFAKWPLASLLILVDGIQEWDRPQFSSPHGQYDWPEDVQSQDVHVLPIENGIGLFYPGDPFALSGTKESHYNRLTQTISKVLDLQSNTVLVREINGESAFAIIKGTVWARRLLQCTEHQPIRKGGILDQAFDIYRRGRSLANHGAWRASADCHNFSAELFQQAGQLDWAARSLGRVGCNSLDLGHYDMALSCLRKASELDPWQGVANYYWALVHCMRHTGQLSASASLLQDMFGTACIDRELGQLFDFCNGKNNDECVPRFEITIIQFFERLVAREVAAGWPSWALSDLGRLYVLRAEVSKDVADTLFEASATAYEDAELSSYASWYHAKAALARAMRATSLHELASVLEKAETLLLKVVQRPGREMDPVTLAALTVTCLQGFIRYALDGNRSWLAGLKPDDTGPLAKLPKKLSDWLRTIDSKGPLPKTGLSNTQNFVCASLVEVIEIVLNEESRRMRKMFQSCFNQKQHTKRQRNKRT